MNNNESKVKKHKPSYVMHWEVKGMSPTELIERTTWLRETVIKKHMNGASKELIEDAMQETALVILQHQAKYEDIGYGNFEGWIRRKIVGTVIQLRVGSKSPLRIPEKRTYKADFSIPVSLPIERYWDGSYEQNSSNFVQQTLSEIDTTVEDNDRKENINELYSKFLIEVNKLPSIDKNLVLRFLKANQLSWVFKHNDRAKELCAQIAEKLRTEFDYTFE